MTDRVFKQWIGHCLACNRELNGVECTRTFKNTDELVGLCNNCIKQSKNTTYAYEFVQGHSSEGETTNIATKNNGYYYEQETSVQKPHST